MHPMHPTCHAPHTPCTQHPTYPAPSAQSTLCTQQPSQPHTLHTQHTRQPTPRAPSSFCTQYQCTQYPVPLAPCAPHGPHTQHPTHPTHPVHHAPSTPCTPCTQHWAPSVPRPGAGVALVPPARRASIPHASIPCASIPRASVPRASVPWLRHRMQRVLGTPCPAPARPDARARGTTALPHAGAQDRASSGWIPGRQGGSSLHQAPPRGGCRGAFGGRCSEVPPPRFQGVPWRRPHPVPSRWLCSPPCRGSPAPSAQGCSEPHQTRVTEGRSAPRGARPRRCRLCLPNGFCCLFFVCVVSPVKWKWSSESAQPLPAHADAGAATSPRHAPVGRLS